MIILLNTAENQGFGETSHIFYPFNMEYDDLLVNYLGEFGLYQRLIYFTLCLTGIPAAFNIMSTVFLVGEPDHWCNTPGLDHLNVSRAVQLGVSIPQVEKDEEMVYSSCDMYDR